MLDLKSNQEMFFGKRNGRNYEGENCEVGPEYVTLLFYALFHAGSSHKA